MGNSYKDMRKRKIAPAVVAAVAAVMPPQPTLGQAEPSRIPVQAALPLLPAPPAAPLLSNAPAQVQLPSFLDDRRLREIESAREATEAELKRKAEAERARIAEEEKKRLAEEEAKRKADEMRQKVADEAEERRKARKLTRQLEKMREDAQTQVQAQPAPQAEPAARGEPKHVVATMTVPAAGAGGAAVAGMPLKSGACGAPKLTSVALPAGRMSLAIDAACRAGETVKVSYGGYVFPVKLDEKGQHLYVLDLFLGAAAPLNLTFADDSIQSVPVETHDLDKVSKIAIVWASPVDLDLHALEYTAARDGDGHVWAAKPSSVETAAQRARERNRGVGFMSTIGTANGDGHKVEVYTFWHVGSQEPGVVGMSVDYVSRGAVPSGEFCGAGAFAEVTFDAVVLTRGRISSRARNALGSAACGTQMIEDARYNGSAVPHLKVQ